jgi:hypothetical protein
MQRRKYLAAVGSLAAAGAAGLGTGAFTSVSADRTVNVSVAQDSNALLKITKATENGSPTPNAANYVDITGNGRVRINIPGDTDGAGVNRNSTTKFDNLLDIQNQGTQTVIVGHQQSFQPQKGAFYHEDYEDGQNPRVGSSSEYSVSGQPDNNGTNLDTIALKNLPVLGPGDTLEDVGFFVTPEGTADMSYLDGATVTFVAAAEPSDLPGSP